MARLFEGMMFCFDEGSQETPIKEAVVANGGMIISEHRSKIGYFVCKHGERTESRPNCSIVSVQWVSACLQQGIILSPTSCPTFTQIQHSLDT